MATKPGSNEKSNNTRRRVDTGDKDLRIAELENRIAVLENELRSKQEKATSTADAERKQAENALRKQHGELEVTVEQRTAALRESEEKYRIVADGTYDWEFWLDPYNRFLYTSPSCERITGYSAREFMDDPRLLGEIIHPDDRRAFLDHRHGTSPGQHGDIEFRIIAKNGETKWIHHLCQPVYDDDRRFAGSRGSNRDITERKQAETAQAWLASIISSSDDAIIGKTLDGVITSWNHAAELLYGYTAGEAIGSPIQFIVPADRKNEVRDILKKIKHGERIDHYETARLAKDGRRIDVSVTISPIIDQGGHIVGASTIAHDITERKQAEEELRHSRDELEARVRERTARLQQINEDLLVQIRERERAEETVSKERQRLNDVMETLPAYLILLTPDYRVAFANSFFRERFGEDRGRRCYEFLFGRTGPCENCETYKVMETGAPHRWEWAGPDGRNYDIYDFPFKDADGSPLIMEMGIDITERKQAENALRKMRDDLEVMVEQRTGSLRESEDKFKAIFNRAALGLAISDTTGLILECNSAYEEMLGYSKEELQEKGYLDFTHPDDVGKNRGLQRQMNEGLIDSYQLEKRYIRKDGQVIWCNVVASAIRSPDGKLKYNMAVIEDITRRKRAEEALRESEAGLARSQEIAHLGSYSWDITGDRIKWSDEHYRILGCLPQEFPVKYETYLGFIHSDDRKRAQRAIAEAIDKHERLDIDYRIVRSDGIVRIAHSEGEASYQDGKPVRLFGTVQDITERKEIEEALTITKGQAELYLDLMGHDINNMNMIAMGFLEIARSVVDSEGKLDSSKVDLLDSALASINNSSRLIGNVRKLQRGRMGEYRSEVYDLGKLVGDVYEQFMSVPDNDVKISYRPVMDVRVEANELLRDVFVNLIGNAIKHSMGPALIKVTMEKDGHGLCKVAVEDNGPGIPDVMKGVIFDRFRRGDTKAHGTGLGLYLVKTLMEGYGGRVWVEDRVKGDHTKGARFVVMLPVVE